MTLPVPIIPEVEVPRAAWIVRLVLACSLVVAIGVAGAPVASAFAGCPVGQIGIAGGGCIDLLTGSGKGGGSITQAAPLNKPGSVLAASNGVGGTTAQNAARAAANGSVKGVSLAGRLGQAGTLVSGFSAGFWLGSDVVAPLLCGNVSGWFCVPEPTTDFVPNLDVSGSDAGWLTGPGQMQVGPSGGSCGTGVRTVDLAPASPPPITGSPVPGSVLFAVSGAPLCWNVIRSGKGQFDAGGNTAALGQSSGSLSYNAAGAFNYVWSTTAPVAWLFCSDACIDALAAVPNTGGQRLAWSKANAALFGGSVYAWPGSGLRPPDIAPDPARTLTTSVVCSSPSGPDVTVTATSAAFHETDATWPEIPVPHCPEGTAPAEVSVTSVSPGLADKPLWGVDVPGNVQGWQQEFPQCVGGGCSLRLFKIGPAGSDVGDCFVQAGRCEGWFEQPEPQRTENYECRYGLAGAMTVLPLSDCYVYAPTFNPQDQARGVGTADPATGDVPLSINDPAPGGDPLPDPGSPEGGACWPSGWAAFNPLQWVLEPVKCALTWAFVPRAEVLASSLTTAATAVKASAPVGIAMGAAGAVTDVVSVVYSSGCAGDVLDVAFAYVVWPCDPPIPGWSYVYLVIVVIVIVGGAAGAFGIIRSALDPR